MEYIKQLKDNKMTVVDFFCGAGIGAIGTEYAGFDTLFAFDNNKHAVNTYNHNMKHKVAVLKDAREIVFSDIPKADIYTGGFPCQPFSTAGNNLGEEDPDKGNLGLVISNCILENEPKGFMLENVSGISNKKNIHFLEKIIALLSTKYNVTCEKINCVDYGVPQERVRIFIFGVRKDLEGKFELPKKTETIYTVRDAIGDLPQIPNNENNHDDLPSFKLRNDEKPFAHKIPVGSNWKSLPDEDKRAFMKGAYFSGGGKTGFLRKVDPDKPSKTIMSSVMGKATALILDWGVDDQRRYTVRESLRLQTVPDTFSFPCSVPPAKQYERCSGIPSLVSYKFMLQLKKAINNEQQ